MTSWRTVLAGFLTLGLGAVTSAAAEPVLPAGVTLVEFQEGRAVLEVRSPQPTWREDPVRGRRVEIPGFGPQSAEQWPWLPEGRVMLAVERPQAVRLEVEVLSRRPLQGLQPLSPLVPLRLVDPQDPAGAGEVLWRRGRERPLPLGRQPAQVGRSGVLRRAPFLEVVLSPVLPAAADGSMEWIEHYRVILTWPAGPAGRRGSAAGGQAERSFQGEANRWLLSPSWQATSPDTSRQVAEPVVGQQSASLLIPQGAVTPVLRPALPLVPDAGSQVYRLDVADDGIYRLNGAWLAASAPDLVGRQVSRLFMAANGVEIPLHVDDDGDGLVSAGDSLRFFGEMVDEDPLDADTWEGGDYTDTRPYYLGVAAGTRLRMDTGLSGTPSSGYPLLSEFASTVRFHQDDLFLNSVPDDLASRWYDGPFLLHTDPLRSIPLALPDAVPAGSASLQVRMLGALIGGNLNGYHRTRLTVNGLQVDEADWDGAVVFTQGVDGGAVIFSAGQITDSTTVEVELPLTRVEGGNPVTTDLVALDWVEVTYPRQFVAAVDSLLFQVANQDATLIVSGLPAADVAVYETTTGSGGVAVPIRLAGAQVTGGGPYDVTFEIAAADSAAAERSFAVGAAGGLQPAAVSVLPVEDDLASGGADWLLIGADQLLDTAPASQLSALVALRQAQGLQTRVVKLSDVYRQFSFGLADPQAIRDFIAWSLAGWSPAPTHVVLLGDATLDFKNSYGHPASRNLLPTYMESNVGSPELTYFSSDNRMAAVVGVDDLPDVLLGRLPVHDLAEAESLFAKLVAYEAVSPGDAWTRRGFFISDEEGGGFESTMRQPINKYFDRPENPGLFDPNGPCFSTGTCRNDAAGLGPLFATAGFQAILNRNPGDPVSLLGDTMTGWIKDGLDDGAAVSQFHGHGGFQTWGLSTDIFTSRSFVPDDVDDLLNGAVPTFLVNVNCITGGFHADSPPTASNDLVYSLAEDFLVTTDRGAIGVIAPSHLTFISLLNVASNTLWDRLLGEQRERRLGGVNLALRLAFASAGASVDLRSFAFLGDPATLLVMPDPEPPGVPSATAGDGVVNLSWSAGPDALSFLLERSDSGAAGFYTLITPPGHPLTSFTDTMVSNGTTYHYRLRGRDANGMDSVLANSNADCPGGPGCVEATPLNPNPPAMPSGFTAVDPGLGGRLDLGWLPNPEVDIQSYRLRYGTDPLNLDQELNLSRTPTEAILAGLANDVPVTLTIAAVNTSGLESVPTPPVEATPRFVLGLRPPRPIIDLTVAADGADAVLTWTSVIEDLYGDPLTINEYRVHGTSVSPVFTPQPGNLLGIVGEQPQPSYRHVDGLAGNGIRYYLVQGEDQQGETSAIGSGLPEAVYDLMVEPAGPGLLRLSWQPITSGVDGLPREVDHYEIYASATPFSRADLEGMTALEPLVLETAMEIPEAAGDYFSVVAVTAHGDTSPF